MRSWEWVAVPRNRMYMIDVGIHARALVWPVSGDVDEVAVGCLSTCGAVWGALLGVRDLVCGSWGSVHTDGSWRYDGPFGRCVT